MAKNQWVSPRNGKWAVKGEGNSRATKIFDKKTDAIDYGKVLAGKKHCELIIQKMDGKIQSKDSYGNDPCPPKDREH